MSRSFLFQNLLRLAKRGVIKRCLRLVALVVGASVAIGVFAASPVQVSEYARSQLNMLVQEKQSRTPAQQKIDSQILLTLDALSPMPRYALLHTLDRPLPDAKGMLALDIDLFDGTDLSAVIALIKAAGGKVGFGSEFSATVRAWLPPSQIEAVAAASTVRFIGREGLWRANKLSTSEGDKTHKAELVRSSLGYTGAGQKICVISDGIDSLAAAKASGDVPASIYVLPGQSGGGDEGTAMLEIVYDLAPGAQLGFASSGNSQAQFAQNIRDLANPAIGACTIIVDDIGFFKESPFQDNDVAEAVNIVTAAGVAYFSAAGNEGNLSLGSGATWEGDFSALTPTVGSTLANLIPGHELHQWAPTITANTVTRGEAPLILHWTDPFGGSANDYDLYVLNSAGTAVVRSSTNTQSGTQDPYEQIFPNSTCTGAAGCAANTGEQIFVAKKTGSANRMFNMQLSRGRLTYATTGSTRGHNAAANGYGVAATPAAVAATTSIGIAAPNGPYPNAFNANNKIEYFSSDGPRRIFYAFNGSLLPGAPAGNFSATGGVIRNKPDITAADGVSTSAPGFATFYGTSAAAPHAAAIAGLIKQAFPSMTLAQLRTALSSNALDIMTPGQDIGSGAGIVRAYETLVALGAPGVPAISLGTVTKTQLAGNGDAFVNLGEDWKLDIALANSSAVGASAVTVTLISNTPGVVVTSSAASYGAIAGNSTASNPALSPFRFSVLSAACASKINFTLSVSYPGLAQPLSFALSFPLGGTLGAEQTFSYTTPVVAIPDDSTTGATATLAVSGAPTTLGKLKVRIDGATCTTATPSTTVGIDHAYISDLAIDIISPANTAVRLWGNRGGVGTNLCQTVFDDAAATAASSVVAANAPFTGSFRPESPLSAFNDGNANGNWNLKAVDSGPADTGSIRAFSIIAQSFTCTAASAVIVTTTATKSVSGSFSPGATVTYLVVLSNTGTGVQADNTGDEYVDVLPSQLTLVSATATRGTASTSGNTARWNGALEAGSSVTLTITATINTGTAGQTVSSQGTLNYDADHNGSNEATRLTDDTAVAGAANPTTFVVSGGPPHAVSVGFAGTGTGGTTSATPGLSCSANCSTSVASGTSVTVTAVPTGGSVFMGWLGACTGTAACSFIVNGPLSLTPTFAPSGTVATLDIDASGLVKQYDAGTDGIMVLRALLGYTGAAISAGATSSTASRSAASIATYLGNINPKLDITGDGQVQLMTDGVLIIRHLLGMSGSSLINGIPLTALRPTATLIENYLTSLTP